MKSLLYPVPGNRSVYRIAKFQLLCLGVKPESSCQSFPENKYLFCFHLKRNRKKPKINILNWYLVLGTEISVIFFSFTFLTDVLSILLTFGSVISAKRKTIIMRYFTLLEADLQSDLYQGRQRSLERVAHFDAENFQKLLGPKS